MQSTNWLLTVGLVAMAACDAAPPSGPVEPTGSYVRSDGATMTIAHAHSTAPHNYRLDLHQSAHPGGYLRAGQDCYVVVVGTLNGNELAGTSDKDEDSPGSIGRDDLRYGVDGRTLGLEVRFASEGASITDHFEGQVCGASFSGSYRRVPNVPRPQSDPPITGDPNQPG
jgi:hypothetical protein